MAGRRKKFTMPLIPVRGLVIFPYMVLHFDVARPQSIAALEQAMAREQKIFLVAQKDAACDSPQKDDLYTVGTVSKIKQILKLPKDTVRVLIEGETRAALLNVADYEPFILGEVRLMDEVAPEADDIEAEAMVRQIRLLLDDYFSANNRFPEQTMQNLETIADAAALADAVAANVILKTEDKQAILEEADVKTRLFKVAATLSKEIEVWSVERQVLSRVKGQMDKNQRDYFLREQMKAISIELGEKEDAASEADEYLEKMQKVHLSEEAQKKCQKEISRLRKMPPQSQEGAVIKAWLDTVLELPWQVKTDIIEDLDAARAVLERDHYGLLQVKDRIIEYLAVQKLTGGQKGSILCLVGPPGVGKTSVARSIAQATGRNYVRVSLGGVRDEAEIRGHRKTYVGSMPGRMINAMRQAQSQNPLILLDEIDKVSQDFKGDISSALLEVLDREQNFSFMDHYLELAFDLSGVLFITTANSLETVPRPLLDRMEVIELSSYTEDEKLAIATNYLIPKQLSRHGLKKQNLKISDAVALEIIRSYTREAGVRNLERQIETLCRKTAKAIVCGEKKSVTLSGANLKNYLGPKRYRYDAKEDADEVGVVCGLAWTAVGGDTLSVEVNVMDGTGKVELTGSLGDVMKESARAAISYIRAKTGFYGISPTFYKDKDIHIHVPEGATPKDGPSAGVTIATAVVSALTGRKVKKDVAMTGEITLRGRVLAIGGLKEKTIAAYRYGITTVVIPEENRRDLEEIPEKVKNGLKFVFAKTADTAVLTALCPAEGKTAGKKEAGQRSLPVLPAEDAPGARLVQ